MKKLAFLLSAVLLASLLCVSAFAATGEELLKSADLYLRFDGTLDDEAGNHTVQPDGDAVYVDGRFGQAAQTVQAENSLYMEDMLFGADSFTVTTWVKVDEHSGDPCLFANKDWNSGANDGWLLCCRANDLKFNANTESGSRTDTEYVYDAFPCDISDWFHIAMVVDRAAETYQLYINGVAIGQAVSFAAMNYGDESLDDDLMEYPFYIGEDGTGFYNMSQTLTANFDEFAVFKSALSEDDVKAIYTYAPEGEEAATIAEMEKQFDYALTSTTAAADVLATADVYMDFENGADDAKGHSITVTGEVPSVEGKFGKGVKVANGASLMIDDYTFGTDSYTVSVWLRSNSPVSSDPVIFCNKDWGSGANPGWLLCVKTGTWQFNANAAGSERVDSSYSYLTSPLYEKNGTVEGLWYNLTLVVDRENNSNMLYIDGYPMMQEFQPMNETHIGVEYDAGYGLVLGDDVFLNGYNADKSFDFDYDDVALFKRVLTADEVAAIALAGNPAPVAEETPAEEPAPVAEEAPAEEPAPVVEEAPAEEPAPADAPVVEEPELVEEASADEPEPPSTEPDPAPVPEPTAAPQTFDAAVFAALAVVVSAAGYAVARKKK